MQNRQEHRKDQSQDNESESPDCLHLSVEDNCSGILLLVDNRDRQESRGENGRR